MSEADWLAWADPYGLLGYLRSRASDRKLRLFSCACCRRLWHLLADEPTRQAVEAAERVAEGADRKLLEAAWGPVAHAKYEAEGETYVAPAGRLRDAAAAAEYAATAVLHAISDDAFGGADGASLYAARALATAGSFESERSIQCEILRCIFGNHFSSFPIDPGWLNWQGGLLGSMARWMYDSRDFGDMSVLADALEDAGCANPDVLAHCRQQGAVHVRGCWVIDLLLGKG
jgi:hypothetical protein